MFELATLILVLYVTHSIFLRSNGRQKEVERLRLKVNELSEIVKQLRDGGNSSDVSEMMLEMEVRDLRAQFEDMEMPTKNQKAFEQLHYVEETISKSIFVPAELPTTAESTL